MTYERVPITEERTRLDGALVSHSADLVRGDSTSTRHEGPLIRPFGPPSPQGEKGRRGYRSVPRKSGPSGRRRTPGRRRR
jgi:hypothetical protein